MEDIGVVFGYAVVIAAIAVVLVGVVMLFIISINGHFAQRQPKGYDAATGTDVVDRSR